MRKTLFKITISGLMVWWLLSHSDLEQLSETVMAVNVWGLVLATAMLTGLSIAQAFRWIMIIRSIGNTIRYTDALISVFIGVFFNQILPSSIGGDGIRVWRAYRLGLSVVSAVHSVALDRLVAMLALVLMAGAGLPVVFSRFGEAPERWGVPVLVAGGLCAFAVLLFFDRIPGKYVEARPLSAVTNLSTDARRVLLSQFPAVPVLAISAGMHIVVALSVYIIARSLALPVEMLDCLILVPPVILLSILPISISGWGVREGAMVTAFALVGIGYDEAFALSVLFGLVIMI